MCPTILDCQPLMSDPSSRQPPPMARQSRIYPNWAYKSDDPAKIADILADFFESALQDGIAKRLVELEGCAGEAGLKLAKLARSAPSLQASPDHRGRHLDTCEQHLRWDADTDDKKAFQELARAILQASGALLVHSVDMVNYHTQPCDTVGFLDVTITLETRVGGTLTGVGFIDKVLKWETFRGCSNSTIRWGNTHASILYGPLRFESGVKTSSTTNDFST